jgi:hypothetical protein
MNTQDEIQKLIEEGLKHYIGEPLDAKAVLATTTRLLEEFLTPHGATAEEMSVLAQLICLDFTGVPANLDLKSLLSKLTDATLCFVVENVYGQDPCLLSQHLLQFEYLKRAGRLVDWEFLELVDGKANFKLSLTKPLEYMQLTFVTEPTKEGTNG